MFQCFKSNKHWWSATKQSYHSEWQTECCAKEYHRACELEINEQTKLEPKKKFTVQKMCYQRKNKSQLLLWKSAKKKHNQTQHSV